jgi:hypothetical protein
MLKKRGEDMMKITNVYECRKFIWMFLRFHLDDFGKTFG